MRIGESWEDKPFTEKDKKEAINIHVARIARFKDNLNQSDDYERLVQYAAAYAAYAYADAKKIHYKKCADKLIKLLKEAK